MTRHRVRGSGKTPLPWKMDILRRAVDSCALFGEESLGERPAVHKRISDANKKNAGRRTVSFSVFQKQGVLLKKVPDLKSAIR